MFLLFFFLTWWLIHNFEPFIIGCYIIPDFEVPLYYYKHQEWLNKEYYFFRKPCQIIQHAALEDVYCTTVHLHLTFPSMHVFLFYFYQIFRQSDFLKNPNRCLVWLAGFHCIYQITAIAFETYKVPVIRQRIMIHTILVTSDPLLSFQNTKILHENILNLKK